MAACAAPAVPAALRRMPESPLDQAGHIGSAVLVTNEAWLAALDGRRTPGEQRYLADLAATRAAAQAQADRDANAAFRPGEFWPAPVLTSGPMSGRHAAPVLEPGREGAMRRYDQAHDSQPAARKRGRLLRLVRKAATRDLT